MPRSRRPAMTFHAARRATGSKPVVGSSRKTSSGSPTSARPTSRRRRWPPDSRPTRSSAFSSRPTSSIVSATGRGSRVVRRPQLERLADGQLRLRLALLQDDPDPRAPARGRRARDRSRARATSPPSRLRKPSRISTVVVLPAPLGPRKAKISPRCTASETARARPRSCRRTCAARRSRSRPRRTSPPRLRRHERLGPREVDRARRRPAPCARRSTARARRRCRPPR